LGVWIFQESGQATPFALTVLFASLPRLLLLPVAGSLADRWDRRWVMIVSDTGSALVTLGAFLLLQNNQLEIWMIYLMAGLGSMFGAFQEPAYTASITMLVPKAQFARTSGLMQTAQALESLLVPVVAGFLFVAIGLRGIILIDFVTYFFAIGALLWVRIPRPPVSAEQAAVKRSMWQDTLVGWRHLYARSGLLGLVLFYALVNFLLNFAVVLMGPMVLSRFAASDFGLVQFAFGMGTLAGSLVLGAWGGPKGRKVPFVIGTIGLGALGLALAGLRPSVLLTGVGMFVLLFNVPLSSGVSQAMFQAKIAPDVQGRVFATRAFISRSMMPVAFMLAGPLADRVLEPLMAVNGALGSGPLGSLLGTGPGRGIGLAFVGSGLLLALACGLVFANPRIRRLEDELPDVV
jgi:MFS family permease